MSEDSMGPMERRRVLQGVVLGSLVTAVTITAVALLAFGASTGLFWSVVIGMGIWTYFLSKRIARAGIDAEEADDRSQR